MIPRYSRQEMSSIWEDRARFDIWLDIEVLAVEGWAKAGKVPKEDAEVVRNKAGYDLERVYEIEETTRHDVVAFTQAMAEKINHPASRWVHFGLTSSDVLDTCLSVQLVRAADLLIRDVKDMMEVLERKADEHRRTVMIGRSHGIHAEPVTFGLVMALWYDEMGRHLDRLQHARDTVRVGQVSGAVGTYAHLDPRVEKYVMKNLKLKAPNITTQVIQRDRHAEFFSTLAQVAGSIEKFALQVRHWQRTEVLEAEEFFHKGQKGSSAMPHKRNPVLSENVTGLARVVRSAVLPALENVALWHERDISHSSAERVIAPDATIALDFMLARFSRVIDKLIVYPDRMQKNLEMTRGLIYSEAVLLKLVESGLTREEAYALVQRNAMKVWEKGDKGFLDYLLEDAELLDRLGEASLKECFSHQDLFEKVDYIFERVFPSRKK
ncbi:MAG: adenylosuccinate lyase [bacterium]